MLFHRVGGWNLDVDLQGSTFPLFPFWTLENSACLQSALCPSCTRSLFFFLWLLPYHSFGVLNSAMVSDWEEFKSLSFASDNNHSCGTALVGSVEYCTCVMFSCYNETSAGSLK